jgi:hypothetical protein
VRGISKDDIELVTPSRRVGTGANARDVPAGTILRPTVRDVIRLPALIGPRGDMLALEIDGSMPQFLPTAGTTLTFTNGLNSTVRGWFVATSFDESTMTSGPAYTGSATVEQPLLGVEVSPVPEPSTLVLALGAAVVLAGYRIWWQRSSL